MFDAWALPRRRINSKIWILATCLRASFLFRLPLLLFRLAGIWIAFDIFRWALRILFHAADASRGRRSAFSVPVFSHLILFRLSLSSGLRRAQRSFSFAISSVFIEPHNAWLAFHDIGYASTSLLWRYNCSKYFLIWYLYRHTFSWNSFILHIFIKSYFSMIVWLDGW